MEKLLKSSSFNNFNSVRMISKKSISSPSSSFCKLLRYFVFCVVFVVFLHIYTLSFHPDYHEHVMKQMRPIILKINETIHQRRGDEIEPQYRRYIEELGLHNPGENGSAVVLPSNASEEIKQMVKEGYDRHGYNDFVSNMIRIDREVIDYRSDICKQRTYSSNLPKASIIIPFHNEAWTLLMRTVHSVLNRSPSELIEEIVLVDDVSDHEELLQHLDDYLVDYPKVKVIRSPTRQGVIRGRLLGVVNAKGPVIVFLDSHVEVMPGWLEPILDRFTLSDNVLVTVMGGFIDRESLEAVMKVDRPYFGGFAWSLDFIFINMNWYEKDNPVPQWDPRPCPTITGSSHAIRKDFFMHIGMLDPDFDIWGGEDVELSFRTWLCGGKVEYVPCAMTAHMSKRHKYSWPPGKGGYRFNTNRIAEVWLDEYKKYYYRELGDKETKEFGDISERLELKKRLNCKPFKWFYENIYRNASIPEKLQDPKPSQ